VLLLVDQTGAACHTNRPNCFFYAVREGGVEMISNPVE
jgi:phosphoribosyl-AMP cyclohydrolase